MVAGTPGIAAIAVIADDRPDAIRLTSVATCEAVVVLVLHAATPAAARIAAVEMHPRVRREMFIRLPAAFSVTLMVCCRYCINVSIAGDLSRLRILDSLNIVRDGRDIRDDA